MTVELGILLALFCALATNLGFLWKHRGACAAPDVDWKHPIRTAIELYSSKWFALGMLVATGAWGFHVAAMALAPLSIVQTVISGGLVFLTVLAERFFGFQVGKKQLLGVGLMAGGLVLLTLTLPHTGSAHSQYSLVAMASFEAALLFVGTMLVLSPKFGAPHEHHGLFLGGASGILFGVSDVSIKALTGAIGHSGVMGLVSPWLVVAIAASVIAFYASARGLQTGDAVPVITLTSAGANVSAIAGGIIVFGDPMATHPVGIVLQSLAFVLVIAAAALMPAPMRAAEAAAAPAAA
jgi:drug/metabolite transporter (DMT)-like permease